MCNTRTYVGAIKMNPIDRGRMSSTGDSPRDRPSGLSGEADRLCRWGPCGPDRASNEYFERSHESSPPSLQTQCLETMRAHSLYIGSDLPPGLRRLYSVYASGMNVRSQKHAPAPLSLQTQCLETMRAHSLHVGSDLPTVLRRQYATYVRSQTERVEWGNCYAKFFRASTCAAGCGHDHMASFEFAWLWSDYFDGSYWVIMRVDWLGNHFLEGHEEEVRADMDVEHRAFIEGLIASHPSASTNDYGAATRRGERPQLVGVPRLRG
jgi:hypothetical protein